MITNSRYDSDLPDFSKLDYADFIATVDAIAGFEKHVLLPSAGGHQTYGYSIGDISKPCVVIDGSIHNIHEWKSAYGVRELMRVLSDPSLYPSEMSLVTALKDKYRFYFIPVVSPDSYINPSTINDNGVWIDHNFDYNWDATPVERRGPFPFSENESINIRDAILNQKTAIYINNHTVGNSNDLIMIRPNFKPEITVFVKGLVENAEVIYSDYNKVGNFHTLNINSSSYNWAAEQEGELDTKVIGQVFEPGFGLTGNQLLSLSVWGMIYFIANVDEWFNRPKKKNKFFFDQSYLTDNS